MIYLITQEINEHLSEKVLLNFTPAILLFTGIHKPVFPIR